MKQSLLGSAAKITAALALFSAPGLVFGHGSVGDPIARAFRIFLENPENPQSSVSADAIAVAGTQAFYDWHEISQTYSQYADPDFFYDQVIPDGQLASAGRAKYYGLDLVRDDWPSTPVNAGPYNIVYDAHVPHDPSYFLAYITRDGWDPTQPLRWSDLEPLAGPENYVREGSLYLFTVDFPQRTGHHVLYVIWQRIDPAGEVFFSTSDIDFGDGSGYGNPESGVGFGRYVDGGSGHNHGDHGDHGDHGGGMVSDGHAEASAEYTLTISDSWEGGFNGEIT
ncbi:MAG: lytic polysaccharide monooxygenase auxiliary activity family 9 protein, partial [Verrucomicrobiota bacterium]